MKSALKMRNVFRKYFSIWTEIQLMWHNTSAKLSHQIDAAGTAMGYFEEVQKVVRRIPRGRVATYGSVARAAGHPGTARQVAWAPRDSKAAKLPWQRVLGQNGKILLTGEAGLYQRTLLEIEGVPFKGSRVDMKRCEFRFMVRLAKQKESPAGNRKALKSLHSVKTGRLRSGQT